MMIPHESVLCKSKYRHFITDQSIWWLPEFIVIGQRCSGSGCTCAPGAPTSLARICQLRIHLFKLIHHDFPVVDLSDALLGFVS